MRNYHYHGENRSIYIYAAKGGPLPPHNFTNTKAPGVINKTTKKTPQLKNPPYSIVNISPNINI